jgi:solute carrier family 25 citrate transporter 1
MLRQGCNQAVNFTAYNLIKKAVLERQQKSELASWQSLAIGGLSGGMGPMVNNPLDVVKTRLQKQIVHEGKTPKYTGLVQACLVISKEEGPLALWKGITPRLLRIMPGQAITFMTYEFVTSKMDQWDLL